MATYNKFECFVGDLGDKIHDLDADTLKVYLTNNAPSASADSIKTDLAGITEENGYAAADITNAWSEAGGTGTLTGTDVVFTVTGGSLEAFRYVVIYNDTSASPVDPLIAWWDYGSAITVNAGETFTVDFGASILTIA